jgi:SAM-dependent methyltransferase
VAKNKPEFHVDIASTLHFCSIVSAFVPVKFYDYRPAILNLTGLTSEHADLTKLDFEDKSIKSLSCLHTIEHIGLGRYGDPIDPTGDIKAAKELTRVLAPGGTFIFVTPVGKPKIAFNAHRIYSYEQVLSLFPDLVLTEFSLVPDNYKETGLITNANPTLVKDQYWGCGCFVFTKK